MRGKAEGRKRRRRSKRRSSRTDLGELLLLRFPL
jgi:hypothetical protein